MPAFPRSLSTRTRRTTAALSAATLAFGVLAAGSGAATAAPGSSTGGTGNPNAGSSQVFGSIADTTGDCLVSLYLSLRQLLQPLRLVHPEFQSQQFLSLLH